jgi:hypothetical protein
VRDEVLSPERGQTRYELVLGDEDVELLSRAMCSESVARQAWEMLEWKRLAARRGAQRLQDLAGKASVSPR